jgi:competence protein ComEC
MKIFLRIVGHYLRRFFSVFVIFFFAALLLGRNFFSLPPALVFFDVGQGDSSLLRFPGGQNILIDGGPDSSLMSSLSEELPYFRRRLDMVIVSHPHDDHVGGLFEVLRRYQVGSLVYAANQSAEPLLKSLISLAVQKKIKLHPVSSAEYVKFSDDCRLLLLNPAAYGAPDDDNNSLLGKINCFGHSILFAGDNPASAENSFLSSGLDLRAEIFKISHHGSKTSNSQEFLLAIQPKIAIISSGRDNSFGHPHSETLEKLVNLGATVKRTDQDGKIRFLFNN